LAQRRGQCVTHRPAFTIVIGGVPILVAVCALLDHARGGELSVAPEGLVEARQRYVPDTGVGVTTRP